MANRGGKVEVVTDFLFLGSKITVDADCSPEIRRCMILGSKAMTNLDSVLKNRDTTLLTKVCIVTAMVFPVVRYSCESWTIKKVEHRRTDIFKLWCWRRLLRVPWITKRSNQSVLSEINPEHLLEGLTVKLKLQYLCHLMQTTDPLENFLVLGKIEGSRRRGHQRMRWLDGIPVQWTWTWVSFGRWWGTEMPSMRQSTGSQRIRRDWATEPQQRQQSTVHKASEHRRGLGETAT